MIKVLNIIGTDFDLSTGGVVSFLKSYLPFFSCDGDFKYDILSISRGDEFSEISLEGNSELYCFPRFSLSNAKKIKALFSALLDQHEYDIIHLHSANMGFVFLPIAKKRAKKIIVHSHNTKLSESYLKCIRNKLVCIYNELFLTHRAACSKDAGVAMFGRKKFTVIPNAIQSSKFQFDIASRNKLRDQHGIGSDELWIGIVGRLCKQKNQFFLLDVVDGVRKQKSNVKLVMIGDGPQKAFLNHEIKKRKLEKNVILVGHQSNVNEYLSAIDLFVLPSVFEGFGIVLLEALAAGLPCVCSDKVAFPDNFGNVKKLPLKCDDWIEVVCEQTTDRCEFDLKKTNYELENASKYVKEWYKA